MRELSQAPLGKKSAYIAEYDPNLLFPIPRADNRKKLALFDQISFRGVDIWHAYELSWLNQQGKPIVATGKFIFPCESRYLIEAKSLKLYFNSFNNTRFSHTEKVIAHMQQDLSQALAAAPLKIELTELIKLNKLNKANKLDNITTTNRIEGYYLDDLDIACDTYCVCPEFLTLEPSAAIISEVVYSDLLKSNCLVTGQPDWGTIEIHYTGKKINHEGLLKYIISFRNHNEFSEHCVERIFSDIYARCQPEKLSVYARYTRRGGVEINPSRSTEADFFPDDGRLWRQ